MQKLYGFMLFAIGILYMLVARPHMAGFEYDDGAYLMGAKMLASGKGYVVPFGILDGATLPGLIKYPPLTSLMFAPLWWLPLGFPDNVMLFKGLNSLLSLAFLGMLAFYCERIAKLPHWQSVCVVLLTALHAQFLHIATETLSEPLYLVLTMSIFLFASRCHSERSEESPSARDLFLMLLLAVLAFYTRTVGILMIIALPLWIVLKGHKKHALITLLGGLALCAGWFLWTNAQPDPSLAIDYNNRHWMLRTLNESYFTSIKTDLLYHHTWFSLYTTGLAALYGQWALEFFPYLSFIPPMAVLFTGFTLLTIFLLMLMKATRQKQFSLPGIYITLYLAILPFWAYHEQYPRFLIVILPFLWIWLFQLLNQIPLRHPGEGRDPAKPIKLIACMIVLAITACNLVPVWFRIGVQRGDHMTLPGQPAVWQDFIHTTEAIKKYTQPEDTLWVSHLVLPYALYTERKYFDAFIQLPNTDFEKMPEAEIENVLTDHAKLWRDQLIAHNVRYIVANPALEEGKITAPMDNTTKKLLERYPADFTPMYISPNKLITVYEFTSRQFSDCAKWFLVPSSRPPLECELFRDAFETVEDNGKTLR